MTRSLRSRRWASSLVATILVAGCASAQPSVSPRVVEPSGSASTFPVAATEGNPSASASAGVPPAAPTASPVPLLGALPTSTLVDATARRLQAALDTIVRGGPPDAVAAVITVKGSWTGAAGVDGPGGRAATVKDEFSIASVSKTFTAALIMRLVEQGKMDLDQPLAAYLGGMAVETNGASVRQALGMRAGLGETPGETLAKVSADCTHAWTPGEVVAAFPPPVAPPGTSYVYSNPTYKLLGFAAEHVTGKPLATAMREVLPNAVGDRLLVQGPARATPKPWALPLKGFEGQLDLASYGVGGTLPCLADSTFSRAGTGMASDAMSLARWGWLLFSGNVLQPSSLRTMITDETNGNGLGIDEFNDFSPDIAYGHTGTKNGYASLLAVLPQRGIVVVMLVNSAQEDVFADARTLIDGS